MKKKIKKEIKEDKFIQIMGRAWNAVSPYVIRLAVIGGIVVVVLLGVGLVYWMKSEREELRKTAPWLKAVELPRERLEALARLYQPVEGTEGFARVVAVPRPETPQPDLPSSRRPASQRKERREPLPLFV